METLRRTPTNSAIESEGVAFGLSGNLVLPIVVAAMVSALLITMVMSNNPDPGAGVWMFVASPTFLTAAYVVLLKNNRKPRFEQDFWEELLEGRNFYTKRRKPRAHPIYGKIR
jgi:hypothetical protein